jgi:serine protease AprX
VVAAAALFAGFAAPVAQAAEASSAEPVSVIVRELPGAGDRPERAVAALGGTVEQSLGIIDGFTASLPADQVGALRMTAGVSSVTEDAGVTLQSADVEGQAGQMGSMQSITGPVTGAADMWAAGYTGRGVDVALIDSGVVPVDGLRTAGKVVHGPDLSFEARTCQRVGYKVQCTASPVKNMDTYGHGTHMAGIIAGRDDAAPTSVAGVTSSDFVGMAPDARIVSIKVADAQGRTDVSQVIAAIDWVVQNRNKHGLNIRVLNMSFGTDGVQDYQLDPLTFAAEQAWHAGVVVVVAAGNTGFGSEKLNNPAYDPYLIAVGGTDSQGTHDVSDDVVATWSATGDGVRNPDLVAPGQSVVSLRVGGSGLDVAYPQARIGERFFRGSGTSQASAVVSGAAALLIQQRPGITPDQVKALLTGTAQQLPAADVTAQGSGLVDLTVAKDAATPAAVQNFARAQGTGTIEAARGTGGMTVNDQKVDGNYVVTGHRWNAGNFVAAVTSGTSWKGGAMVNGVWDGGSWLGNQWFGNSGFQPSLKDFLGVSGLTGLTWSGLTWSGLTWSGLTWSGLTWSGLTWSGLTWSGLTWSGLTWSGLTWSGLTWSGLTWSGSDWS